MPFVSCVMPTYGRADYVAESVRMFLDQDYPSKELLILNDCPGQTFRGELPGVRIINADQRWSTLGDKRNAIIQQARGELIAVWDDDDVYLPWRLSQAVNRLRELNAAIYCPAEYWAYWGAADLHDNQARLDWIYHPLVVFQKSLWQAVGGYPPLSNAEDTALMRKFLDHLSIAWPQDPIRRYDRPMIMRGKSKYHHTSIGGGEHPPDTRTGEIRLVPCDIQDPILRDCRDRLLKEHRMTTQLRGTPPPDHLQRDRHSA
ncbi:glycosyltransferase family 2 protein [Planctomicrobium piriforme]|uniref:Glycosyl transferase family 2 n=1 Tax=Planctomicrobium piriforme TaxID=1576369 RepID=A0A1I3SJR1_9PLAN|nr:glycosyltransferase family 2 protein [Planctomicrobium piriforme]SFJ57686.1 Glycosyl transferase family 2 [Planctomicrobium piriforme]